jgi:indolepyruvate ferredoxin oxidoreductase beta subunit
LPFPRDAYEAAIRHAGKGVDASLAAFAAGHARAVEPGDKSPAGLGDSEVVLPHGLREQVAVGYSEPLRTTVTHGVSRMLDYQDEAYAALYLARLEPIVDLATDDGSLANEVARHLALWMAFEDTFRVADLKSRPERMARIRTEVGATAGQLVHVTEYLHPRIEEVADSLPEPWGRRVLGWPWLRSLTGMFVGHGRKVATHTITGYLQLWLLARGRNWRRQTPRYAREQAAIEAWLELVRTVAPSNPALAVELARCQALVRGYGDTLARGQGAYERILAHANDMAGDPDAAAVVARLREAALADEQGTRLGEVLVTLERKPGTATA